MTTKHKHINNQVIKKNLNVTEIYEFRFRKILTCFYTHLMAYLMYKSKSQKSIKKFLILYFFGPNVCCEKSNCKLYSLMEGVN